MSGCLDFPKGYGDSFEGHAISIFEGEHLKPEMLKINPFHKYPFIKDGDFQLAESAAIMRYLAVKYKVADHWYPRSDVQRQARVDEFFHWHQQNIRKHEIDVFLPTFRSRLQLNKATPTQPLDKEQVACAKSELGKSVAHIDKYFLAGRPYIGGKEISAADISGVSELMQLTGVEEEGCYESNGNVKAWAKRVKERLQPHFDVAFAKVYGVQQKFKSAA